MSSLIRTEGVPAADLVDFLREVMAKTWLPMECCPQHRANYCAEFRASGLGPMQVVVMDVPPATVRRTPELISRADPDMLKMVLVRGGDSCVVAQDGRQACLSAGEFAIYDTRRPYEVVCGAGHDRPMQMMTFMFPPSLLPLSRNRVEACLLFCAPLQDRRGNSLLVPSPCQLCVAILSVILKGR